MITVFLGLAALIAAIGWLLHSIAIEVLVKYMKDKGYTPPSDEEIKAYFIYVLKRRFHID